MKKQGVRSALVLGAVGTLLALTACSSGPADAGGSTGEELDPEADVTITVGGYPAEDEAERRAAFDDRVAAFEEEYPNITVEPVEVKWEAQTFQAMLAGGTLPTVMFVPFTYAHELIASNQAPDMTPYLEEIDLIKDLNPLALANASKDDKIYFVPSELYSLGIAYNRDLFEQAGLDPDAPPTTWDEVREFAKQIADNVPGATGYAQLTTNNTGGWMLTAMTYSMGGAIQDEAGSKAEIGDASVEALQLLHDMRWEDNSMGEQFLYDQETARQDFAAGKIGMMLQGPDVYGQVVSSLGMDKDAVGVGAMPQANGENGTLSGGSLSMFDVKASPNELLAAAKWTQFDVFGRYFNEDAAVTRAQSDDAAGKPVGLPGLPPVSAEANETYLGWIEEYVNVPREHFSAYIASELPLITEPAMATQQTYAALDPVVQKVLTDENVDIETAVEDAAKAIDALIAQGNR